MSGYSSNKVRAGVAICAILIVYCLIAGIFLISYIQRVTGRIYRIGTNMEEIGSHRFKILDQMRGHDEISRLENQYNGMLKKLEQTIEEMTEIKTKRQSLEIKVLESQINPHFLYNTLGVMRWKALGAENDELCRMIDNMTTFYRLSLSKGQGLITVKNEVELIRAYIALQQYRYDDCVDYHIDVEDEALQILMPKMILQPLVENIYLHADIVLEGKRKIGIEIKKREERIYIKVRDNGNGMTEETLYNVNHNINLSEEHGIGISFIYSSLQVFYGEEGKMEFHSIQGKGTCVEISFPTQTKWEALERLWDRIPGGLQMKVLLVDDEAVQLRGLCKYVHWGEYGCEQPHCAGSGKEALRKIAETTYDIVITDVSMPEMNGLEMIVQCKKRMTELPCFVILSGFDEFAYAQEAIRLGVRFYVLKPIKVEEIEEVLKTIYLENQQKLMGENDAKNSIAAGALHPVIFGVVQYIDKEYAENISIQDLSEKFAINSSYLSSLFKKEMNMNISTYITKVRMHNAVRYLKEGKYRISEIAVMVGYQTPAYFSEQFRKEFGCNPKDYKL